MAIGVPRNREKSTAELRVKIDDPMSEDSHESVLTGEHPQSFHGVGVDVGGSGVRASLYAYAWKGHGPHKLRQLATCSFPHSVDGLARTLARCIDTVQAGASGTVALGVATPGLKTLDRRGILRARNLDPAPDLLDELGERIHSRVRLPARLDSDADAALIGETLVEDGLLSGVRDALFLSPGTGLAEAWLQDGQLQTLRGPRAGDLPPLLRDGAADDLEDEASLGGLIRRWHEAAPHDGQDGGQRLEEQSIEAALGEGNEAARRLLERFGEALAQLIDLRLSTLPAPHSHSLTLCLRSRRGRFFSHGAVRAVLLPALLGAAERHGAVLRLPSKPCDPFAACAGALALGIAGARDRL